MAYRTTGHVPRWACALALLAALSACIPFNGPTPTPATPVKTPTLTPVPVTATPLVAATLTPAIPPVGGLSTTNTPSPACLATPGRVLNGVINSALLAKPITYRAYLPPCYFDEPETHYPTLYLLHGQTYNEDQWIRLGVPAAMNRMIAAGQIPPFIVIFPYDYSYLQPPQYHFEDVFMGALIPQVDAAYRTIPDAAHRAIGGLSRGAAWALHLGIHHPDTFGAIGAHSPAIFYSDAASLPLILRDIPAEQLPRIYIDFGDADEQMQNNLDFKKFLDEYNVPYEWHANIGFHDETYWAAHVNAYLRWYAQGWSVAK